MKTAIAALVLSLAAAAIHVAPDDSAPMGCNVASITEREHTPAERPEPLTLTETVITITKPVAAPSRAKVWTCGAPRALDAVQTVKDCEWK